MRSGLPGRSRVRAILASVASIAVTAGLLVAVSQPASASVGNTVDTVSTDVSASADVSAEATAVDTLVDSDVVKAADLSKFDAGNIITDAVFFNSSTMTSGQIQAFLESKVSSCRSGYTCLKDAYDTTRSVAADSMCNAYSGGSRESASTIIYKVAKACGINPQVLLVMLQKEQGLVTHTWPSDWRYTIAMGQGCPDTAACDTKYYGFFNQVYGAARQLKIYTVYPTSFNYRAGQTNSIYWHPNASCGTSSVYIQNQATANLYIYTPYRPNQAALNAGYGTGDSCSSYGNRNFYNYFTDWFGSTQTTVTPSLVKKGTAVWLISGKRRYHVTAEAYSQYKPVLGAPVVVDQAYLNAYTDSGEASFYVRNAKTGRVAYLEDGKTHRFTSCSAVARWGGSCGDALVQLTPALFAEWGTGSDMTEFVRLVAGGQIHQLSDGELTPLFDSKAAASRNGGKTPFAAVMRPSTAATYSVTSRTGFAYGTLITVDGGKAVYLPTSDGRLIHLPSWSQSSELGLPSSVQGRASDDDVKGYTRSGVLSSLVLCDDTTYFAGNGALYPYLRAEVEGIERIALDADTCSALAIKTTQITGDLFIRPAGSSATYHLVGSTLRHVMSPAQLAQINGGEKPQTVAVGPAQFASWTMGAEYPVSGSLVRAVGSSAVWFVDGISLIHISTWTIARQYGLSGPSIAVDPGVTEGLETRDALGPYATCEDVTYFAAGGELVQVSSSEGAQVTVLGSSACAALGDVRGGADSLVVADETGRSAIAASGGFIRLDDADAVARATGGSVVTDVEISSAYFDILPEATDLPVPGTLVRASNESAVTILDSGVRYRIPNWGVAADWGLTDSYRIVEPALIANEPLSTQTAGVFVSCNSQLYLASQGVLHAIADDVEVLDSWVELGVSACDALDLSGDPVEGSVVVSATDSDSVYELANGSFRVLTADEVGALAQPALELDPRTVASLPLSE